VFYGISVMLDHPPVNPSVTVADALPTTLSDKHERFCQELMSNGGHLLDAYDVVYPGARSKDVMWAAASRLRARQDVRARIDELSRLAAQRAVIDRSVLLTELHEIATANPDDISRVVTDPCRECWPVERIAAAIDAAAAPGALMPDFGTPREDCDHCRGRGSQRVVITPTHELRGAARRLYAGARQRPDGSIEVQTLDQLAARKELHALLGLHVTRSVNTNLNVTVDPSKPNPWDGSTLTPAQVLERVRRSRAPITIEADP
jgi:phage terminase small subunit